MQEDINEGYKEVEDEPDVDELNVGCPWQRVRHADEEGNQDKQGGEVNRHYSFKVRRLIFRDGDHS